MSAVVAVLVPVLLFIVAPVLLTPGWGPGTHIQLTRRLLKRFRAAPGLRPNEELVLRHPDAFLYGNIAADIINFKSFGGIKNHCHNWNIHERLENLSRDDGAFSFVLGYLCHLAADIVAHNHFVPYHIVYDFPPRILGHPYWEAIADTDVSDGEWHTIDRLKESREIHTYDRMVHRAVKIRVLGLRSNRWIFNNITLISCRQNWRSFIKSVRGEGRLHPLDLSFYNTCLEESLKNMVSVFYLRRLALLKVMDPTGKQALRGARMLRRELVRDFGSREQAQNPARDLARQAYGF